MVYILCVSVLTVSDIALLVPCEHHKNCVKFRLQTSPITITLIYSLKYIGIHVRVPACDISKDSCIGICSIVLDGLESSAKVQNYKHMRLSCYSVLNTWGVNTLYIVHV